MERIVTLLRDVRKKDPSAIFERGMLEVVNGPIALCRASAWAASDVS